jgi:hypothetical protein
LVILDLLIYALTGFEAHESSVDQQRAYVIKTLIAQFINTAVSYCLVSLVIENRIWSRSGVILQMSVLFFAQAVIQTLTNIIYLPSLMRHWTLSNYNPGMPIPRYQDRFNK